MANMGALPCTLIILGGTVEGEGKKIEINLGKVGGFPLSFCSSFWSSYVQYERYNFGRNWPCFKACKEKEN